MNLLDCRRWSRQLRIPPGGEIAAITRVRNCRESSGHSTKGTYSKGSYPLEKHVLSGSNSIFP